MKFRKKPVVIDAVQWVGEPSDLNRWLDQFHVPNERPIFMLNVEDKTLTIPTLEGDHRALLGDWIIRGVNGEYYPCKPDIFEKTYEGVEP
jgi:hypothetical protein